MLLQSETEIEPDLRLQTDRNSDVGNNQSQLYSQTYSLHGADNQTSLNQKLNDTYVYKPIKNGNITQKTC